MTDQPPTDPLTTRQRVDFTGPGAIIGGFIFCAILLSMVPVFWILVPFAILGMVALFFIGSSGLGKARKLAKQRLGPSGKTDLYAEFSPGITAALIMNDWGIVFAQTGKSPVQIPWGDITKVDEPVMTMLTFHSRHAPLLKVDLSQDRYFLAIQSLHSKIPGRTDFQVDPVTFKSVLLQKLEKEPFHFSGNWGKLTLTRDGVEHSKGGKIAWSDIESVKELDYQGDESPPFWDLTFTGRGGKSFVIEKRDTLADDREFGYSAYDMIKSIVHHKIPDRTYYTYRAYTPDQRAEHEFDMLYENTKAAMSVALQSGKWDHLESIFAYCRFLEENFVLRNVKCDVKSFYLDYAELMSRTNRGAEAKRLTSRAEHARPYEPDPTAR